MYERLGQTQRAARAILAAGELASASRRATAASRVGNEVESRTAALEAIRADATDAEALRVLLAGLSPAATTTQLEELTSVIGAARAAELLDEHARTWPPADAQVALERAVTLVPTAHRWLALARLLDGDRAAAAWSSALLLDPASAEAALGHAASQPPHDAALTLERALAAAPASVERDRVAARLGELEEARGNHAAALAAFSSAMQSTGQGGRHSSQPVQ